MLEVDLKLDAQRTARIVVRQTEAHARIKHAFWYDYLASVSDGSGKWKDYSGNLVHSPESGPLRLAQKVLKAISRRELES